MKFLQVIALTTIVSLSSAFANGGCKGVLEGLPAGWKQNKILVPFDWNNPDSERIEVAYYYRDQSLFVGKTPIIFFNGGPTVAGNLAIKSFSRVKAFDDQNMIYMDQRGTGCSTNFKDYTQNSDIEEFRNYGSSSIVKDAEAIRQKLFGDQKWKIYGQSYGGLISFRYLELFPESIASAHIHGYGVSDRRTLDERERRIGELTPEILRYKNTKVSPLTIGEIVDRIKNAAPENKEKFDSVCVKTVGAKVDRFCGEDVFSGLFMITGFRDLWVTAHKYLFNIMLLVEKGNQEELETYYTRFASIYMLRFNDPNQAAALHAISFNEMFNGGLIYDGCENENELISECRFHENFTIRLNERPTFKIIPINFNIVRENIKSHQVPIFYYAGMYDSFLPIELLRYTAQYLNIESSFHVFLKSGHEGYISEKLVIENLIR